MKLIIIAAGQGSRIRSVTNGIPKTLLKLKGKTLLDRLLENAISVGIKDAIIVTGYSSQDLETYIDNHRFDINIETFGFFNLHITSYVKKYYNKYIQMIF